ncbi:MAG TPA: Xaa-Pro peptidase family protein [Candidatus Acidoferrum sp.]|nr:Xaa-Pro peptidase family protein [Candidatus Acidoferrum sp.]
MGTHSIRHSYLRRLELLRQRLRKAGASAILVTHPPNVYYLCGFTGDSGALLVENSRLTLYTDGRFRIQAREESRGARVEIVRVSPPVAAGAALGGRRRPLECAYEDDRVTVAQLAGMRKHAGPSVRWLRLGGAVEALRVVKDAGEIRFMRDAAALASRVVAEVIELIRPGMRECEVAAEIDYKLRRGGASGTSFETIVASGPRSALPHARPTGKVLARNELVVLDLGAILRGYSSDLTRTVYLGRAPKEIRRWYGAVVEAQAAAREVIRAGVAGGEVDAAARGVLERAGLGRYFVHSTGHGLGLEVHENPRLAREQKNTLPAGSVVAVEPGVYVPGRGGIRLEDDVLVLEKGCEVLTTASRDLIEISA